MPTAINPIAFEDQGWTVRYQPPEHDLNAPVILLLHGWTGDEKVMWIFTRALAGRFWLFAPRAPIAVPSGGYAWLPHGEQRWPALQEFQPIVDQLLPALDRWSERVNLPVMSRLKPFHLMGFSQGAAMSFAVTAYYPARTAKVAALAGFFPRSSMDTNQDEGQLLKSAYAGRSVYMAHGKQDEIVPVSMAVEAKNKLEHSGASVTFCESEVGHKMSAGCLRGLEEFFA